MQRGPIILGRRCRSLWAFQVSALGSSIVLDLMKGWLLGPCAGCELANDVKACQNNTDELGEAFLGMLHT